MGKENTIRQAVVEEINKLTLKYVEEILDFAKYLEMKNEREEINNSNADITEENPLLDLIGIIEHGSLAQDIDKELYG